MIQDFLHTWPLFAHTYLTGWLLAVLLSLLGVYVVARDQIFVGAAIAQASTLGIALSMVAASCLSAFHLHALEFGATTWAVVFACLAAYVMSLAFGRRESHEAVAAWIFLAGGSLSVLVVAHSPHGLDEIQRLVSSSLIGATAHDTVLFAAADLVDGIADVAAPPPDRSPSSRWIPRWRRHWTAVPGDGPPAWPCGWDWPWAVPSAAQGCFIPSEVWCYRPSPPKRWPGKFVRSSCSPLCWRWSTAGAGFMLAHHFDFPPAQATVGLAGGFVGCVLAGPQPTPLSPALCLYLSDNSL
jgi:hypothetical protein